MPPTPPSAARRGVRALLLVALPLLAGFATGALLATTPIPGDGPPAEPARTDVVREGEPAGSYAQWAERSRRRARARARRDQMAAASAAHEVDVPTRRSVQAAIDSIDPRDWLAAYGTVTEAPVGTAISAE